MFWQPCPLLPVFFLPRPSSLLSHSPLFSGNDRKEGRREGRVSQSLGRFISLRKGQGHQLVTVSVRRQLTNQTASFVLFHCYSPLRFLCFTWRKTCNKEHSLGLKTFWSTLRTRKKRREELEGLPGQTQSKERRVVEELRTNSALRDAASSSLVSLFSGRICPV